MTAPTIPSETSGGESLLTVLVALVANALLAAAKSVAAAVTGSASMVAERSGSRPRDDEHPRGYGRSTYIWSLVAAFGLFSASHCTSSPARRSSTRSARSRSACCWPSSGCS